MRNDTIERLIDDLGTVRGDHYATIKDQILKAGASAVPCLIRAYRAKKIERWTCFEMILEMDPDVYEPVLEAARDDNEEALAILHVVGSLPRPLPEVIPILVDVLQSTHVTKLLCCMNTILHAHPLIEVHCPERLPLFAPATGCLLDLLGHESEYVRTEAAKCLAVLKPAEPDILPALMRLLKTKDPIKDSREVHALIQAIGAQGPEAACAVPMLTEFLRSKAPHWLGTQAACALAQIGEAALSTIPLLEEYRDNTQLPFKSHATSFKRAMNRSIGAVRKASEHATTKPRKGDPYLLDLIDRMGEHGDAVFTSANSTSGKAYEEQRHLADASLIPKIGELLDTRLNRLEFSCLMSILGCVTRNTDSEDGRRLILSLFSQQRKRKSDWDAIITVATMCRLKEASPFIRRLMFMDNGRHVSSALDYFKATKDVSAVDDIDCCLRASAGNTALLCIFALGEIGSPKAARHLLDAIKKPKTSRKRIEWEQRDYGIRALGQIKAVDAVADLIAMLSDKEFEDHRSAIIDALCRIGDKRAFIAVLATLREIIDTQIFSTRWSPGHRTIIVNGLDYFDKIDKHNDPPVLEIIESLRSKSNCGHLLEEERQFIRQRWKPNP